jgi:hypothetical protein
MVKKSRLWAIGLIYRAYLSQFVLNDVLRKQMSQNAIVEARTHTWHEAMECLLQGYREIVLLQQPLLAA